MGKVLVGNLNGINTFFEEVLLSLVENDPRETGTVKANSGPQADDDTGEEEFVEDGGVDSGKGSAVGSLLGSVFLDPSWLDAAVGEEKDSLLEALLEFSDEFFIDGGEEELAAAIVDMDEDEWLVLVVGVLSSLDDSDTAGQLLALGIQMANGFDEGTAYLLLQMGESLYRARGTAVLPPRDFSNTSTTFLVSVILENVIGNILLK